MCCLLTDCTALILQYRTGTSSSSQQFLILLDGSGVLSFHVTPLFNLAQPYLLLCEYTYETSIYKVKECDRPFDNYLDKS